MLHLPGLEDTLAYHPLRGEISPSLLELEHLTHLDLSFNDFEGTPIPPFLASLTKMQFLNLSRTGFTGRLPSQLGNLSNLLVLDLSLNYDLQSENLEWLSHLSSLRYLDLSYLSLSKAIHWSQAINKLPSLVHLNLKGCDLPPLTTPSLSHVNSSAPLAFLDLSHNYDLTSSVYPWLFNFSTTLVHLHLSWNIDLNGSIPDAFGNMISLAYLDLSGCACKGEIPDAFGKLSSLEYLDISSNQLDGQIPYTFGNMTSLAYLDLSYNQLHGELPGTIGDLVSLAHLDLSNNQLQGSIPGTIGRMVSLEKLSLSLNQIQGEIPKSFSDLCNLQVLELDSNNLTGQIAPDFMACANGTLEILHLSDNKLTGSVPRVTGFSSLRELFLDHNQLSGTLPESIGQLPKLQALAIGSNSLQGTISEAHLFHLSDLYYLDSSSNSLTFKMSLEWVPPFQLSYLLLTSCQLGPRFPSCLQNQKQLVEIDISNSGISDAFPDRFWNLTSIIRFFNISNNQITGTLPNLSSKFVVPTPESSPFVIDMSSNSLEGSIPQLPSSLMMLYLSNNKFSGSISFLCAVTQSNMGYIDLSNNSFTGELPNCWPQWKSLIVLNLANNQFSGKIPNSLGSLQSLQTLHLRNNNLIGELPSSLQNCKSLRLVDLAKNSLSGIIPVWIGGSFPNLIVLNLQSNRFSGSLCSELCQLKKIQILDLSSNNISGTIPTCLNNLTAMIERGNLIIAYLYPSFEEYDNHSPYNRLPWVEKNRSYVDRELVKWKGREWEYKNTLGLVKSIDLSSNKLTGEIPKEVTDLRELVSLNLSRNNLTGLIPVTIGQLKSLDILDLSQNQLIGEIPISLSEIDRLSNLDLSHNNLSGEIPRGTQLQSFNTSTYEGNPTLCGLPLLKKCLRDIAEEAPNTYGSEDNVQQKGNDMWFYVSIALGFIVGFWGVCGTLLLNHSWRHNYFQFLNGIKDWLL